MANAIVSAWWVSRQAGDSHQSRTCRRYRPCRTLRWSPSAPPDKRSADAAAKHYGVPLAFADPVQLAQHPDVDLVTVCVKVPDHFSPVMAAIDAGKHVYSEWPLGRNTEEARQMHDAAQLKGYATPSACRAVSRRRSTMSGTSSWMAMSASRCRRRCSSMQQVGEPRSTVHIRRILPTAPT